MKKLLLIVSTITIIAILSVSLKVVANSLTPEEELRKASFFDQISSLDSMSCATCHAPRLVFTDLISGINMHGAAHR